MLLCTRKTIGKVLIDTISNLIAENGVSATITAGMKRMMERISDTMLTFIIISLPNLTTSVFLPTAASASASGILRSILPGEEQRKADLR
jgi:hypothetical protein